MTKALAFLVRAGRNTHRMVVDWLAKQADDAFRAAHRPEEVGPPERLACLRCQEAWPCAEMVEWANERAARKEAEAAQ